MSFDERIIIGHFDPERAAARRQVPSGNPPVTEEEIARLQKVVDAVLGVETREPGESGARWPVARRRVGSILWYDWRLTADAYVVACAAHELFGMSAVDVAHGTRVYPDEPGPDTERAGQKRALADLVRAFISE